MRLPELKEEYTKKINDAERMGSEAPVAEVLRMVVDDLQKLDRITDEQVTLTTSDVADRYEVEPKTVAKWCRQGRYPNAWKTGEDGDGEWRIPQADLRDDKPEPRRGVDKDRVSFRNN